jgi:hypothetical protein
MRQDKMKRNQKSVQESLAVKNVKMIRHPPSYSPNIAPADFFLFPRVNWPLAVPGQLQDKLGRGHADRCQTKHQFSNAFWRWYERCNKCIGIGENHLEKS